MSFLRDKSIDRAILIFAPILFQEPYPSFINETIMIQSGLEKLGSFECDGDRVECWSRPGLPWPTEPLQDWPQSACLPILESHHPPEYVSFLFSSTTLPFRFRFFTMYDPILCQSGKIRYNIKSGKRQRHDTSTQEYGCMEVMATDLHFDSHKMQLSNYIDGSRCCPLKSIHLIE